MNFYMRNLGDYAKDTANLSALEVGVYDLLLDFYYAKERALPLNRVELTTLVRARNRYVRNALDKVLTTFFEKTEIGYLHHRAEKEIAKANAKSSKARRSAEARWEAQKADANASKGGAKKNANAHANASDEKMRSHRWSIGDSKTPDSKPKTIGNSTCVGSNPTRARAQEKRDTHTHDSTADDDPPSAPPPTAAPNPSAVISRTMREHGIAKAAPSNVRIVALAEAGVSEARVIEACDEAHATHPDGPITANYVCSILEAWQHNGHGTPRIVKANGNGHGPPRTLTPVQQREADARRIAQGVYAGLKSQGEVIEVKATEVSDEQPRRIKNS